MFIILLTIRLYYDRSNGFYIVPKSHTEYNPPAIKLGSWRFHHKKWSFLTGKIPKRDALPPAAVPPLSAETSATWRGPYPGAIALGVFAQWTSTGG